MSKLINSMFSEAITPFTGITAAAVLFCIMIALSRWRANPHPYPPGPRPDPIIGNVRDMMSDYPEQEFQRWRIRYGDVNFVKIFSQPLVVLNSFAAAKDLLVERGAIYSGRPRLVLIAEMMGWGDDLVHMQPGSRHSKHRSLVKDRFSPRGLEAFRALQRKEVYITLLHLGRTPDDFQKHLKRFTAGVILKITYGYSVHSHDDQFVRYADEATRATVSVSPAAMLVDFFPILKHIPSWMPFAGFKRHASHTRILVLRLVNAPYKWIKNEMANGTASSCIATELLENLRTQPQGLRSHRNALDDQDIKEITSVLYAAATDTTGSVLSSFFLYMAMHEEVFTKAQAEVDRKIGNDRLVDFDDKGSLPFLDCVLKEVLRMACPVPLGVPHRSTLDDVYQKQFIPKNSTVIANAWAMMRNEEVYPEAYKFKPERFEGCLDGEAAQQVDAVFGFGRRVCPGKGFAEANVWLLAANFIAMFSLQKAVNGEGNQVGISGEYSCGYVRHPKEFHCQIRHRSERAKGLIEQANLLHN